jgi:hypothetical protein
MANLILRLDSGDAVIDRSTAILRDALGCEVVTPQNMTYLIGRVAPGETLYINGHGDADTMGGLTVSELAGLLAKHNLKGSTNIAIIGCNTGWGGAPYALNLKVELVQAHKIRTAVSAPTGFISVRDDGSTYVDMDIADATAPDGVRAVPVPLGKSMYRTTRSF